MKITASPKELTTWYDGLEREWPDGLWYGRVRGHAATLVLKTAGQIVFLEGENSEFISEASDVVKVRRVTAAVTLSFA